MKIKCATCADLQQLFGQVGDNVDAIESDTECGELEVDSKGGDLVVDFPTDATVIRQAVQIYLSILSSSASTERECL